MKLFYKYFFMFILTICLNAQENDTTYITPAELEPGWGFYWRNPAYQEIEVGPKSYIWSLAVSPDGKYLAYRDWDALKVLDLKTKEIIIISYGVEGIWSADSRILQYIPAPSMARGSYFWFPESRTHDTLCTSDSGRCVTGNSMAWENNTNYKYFAFPQGYPPPDSLVYKTNLDSSLKVGYPVYELIEGLKWKRFRRTYPIFPPNGIIYNIQTIPVDEVGSTLVKGFALAEGYNIESYEIYYFPYENTWEINDVNTFGEYHSPDMILGPNGDVYAYLSFRSKTEIANDYDPPFDSAAIAARNACGWYRVDTSGTNLVQLVRSWTYNVGGLSITGDGETIYYGIILEDSCAGIMKMNKYGKNKELVLRLEPIILSVEDGTLAKQELQTPMIKLNCFPDISGNYLKVLYNINGAINSDVMVFSIYGLNGNLILSKKIEDITISNSSLSLDISRLANGLYFVIAESYGFTGHSRFIICK